MSVTDASCENVGKGKMSLMSVVSHAEFFGLISQSLIACLGSSQNLSVVA